MLACDLIMEVRASRSVTADHAARLERSMPIGSPVIAEQIDLLFQIDHYAERADPAWTKLLARAVISGLVLAEAPMGALDEVKADWLIEKIGRHRISAARHLELVARVMARADAAPAWLGELLVELSARHHGVAAPGGDARGLQVMLAESFPQAPAEAAAPERETGIVVQMPERVAIPLAAAA